MSDDALRKHMALQQANQHNHKQSSKPMQDNRNPAALNVMNELFIRLKAISAVGRAFKTEAEEAIVKQEWMFAFKEEGITKQSMIDDGIELFRAKARKSRTTTWFPSIGEFVDLCLGTEDKLEFAQRALDLFNSGQKQIDSVGKMVTGKHGFDLKQMKAADTNKRFIELYLSYAENNAVEPLKSHLLTETVQLNQQQQEEADKRAQVAQKECLNKLRGLFGKPEPKKEVEQVKAGIVKGKVKSTYKSPKQLDDERKRQLEAIKLIKPQE